MISGKSIVFAGLASALAMIAGPSAIAADAFTTPEQGESAQRVLSAAELAAYLNGSAQTLPDYCWVQTSPLTGQCTAIICAPPGGFWEIHECDWG
jgi:hypothetical protein